MFSANRIKKLSARFDRYSKRIEVLADKHGIPLSELQAEASRRSAINRARRRCRMEKEGTLLTNQDFFAALAKQSPACPVTIAEIQAYHAARTRLNVDCLPHAEQSNAMQCQCSIALPATSLPQFAAQNTNALGFRSFFQAVQSFLTKTLSLTSSRTLRK